MDRWQSTNAWSVSRPTSPPFPVFSTLHTPPTPASSVDMESSELGSLLASSDGRVHQPTVSLPMVSTRHFVATIVPSVSSLNDSGKKEEATMPALSGPGDGNLLISTGRGAVPSLSSSNSETYGAGLEGESIGTGRPVRSSTISTLERRCDVPDFVVSYLPPFCDLLKVFTNTGVFLRPPVDASEPLIAPPGSSSLCQRDSIPSFSASDLWSVSELFLSSPTPHFVEKITELFENHSSTLGCSLPETLVQLTAIEDYPLVQKMITRASRKIFLPGISVSSKAAKSRTQSISAPPKMKPVIVPLRTSTNVPSLGVAKEKILAPVHVGSTLVVGSEELVQNALSLLFDGICDLPKESVVEPRLELHSFSSFRQELERSPASVSSSLFSSTDISVIRGFLGLAQSRIRSVMRSAWHLSNDDHVWIGLECCLVVLEIVVLPDLPLTLGSEDLLDDLFDLVWFHTAGTVLPALEAGRGKSRQADLMCPLESFRSASSRVLPSLFEKTAKLLSVRALADSTLVKISNLLTAPFFLETPQAVPLQVSALCALSELFCRHPLYRQMVLEEIVSEIGRLSSLTASRRSRQTFRAADRLVMPLTACVLTLVQSCGAAPISGYRKEDAGVNSHSSAFGAASLFLQLVLSKYVQRGPLTDNPFRHFLTAFAKDTLNLLSSFEYPAAEMILSILANKQTLDSVLKEGSRGFHAHIIEVVADIAVGVRKVALEASEEDEDDKWRAFVMECEKAVALPFDDDFAKRKGAALTRLSALSVHSPLLWPSCLFYVGLWGSEYVEIVVGVTKEGPVRTNLGFPSVKGLGRTLCGHLFSFLLLFVLDSLQNSQSLVRSRAMKGLARLTCVDSSLLMRDDIKFAIQQRILDQSISVRESTIDLLGGRMLSNELLLDPYLPTIISRTRDVGYSVRKRAINIARDVARTFGTHERIVMISLALTDRLMDSEKIVDRVKNFFREFWFSVCSKEECVKRACIIVDVCSRAKSMEWLLSLVRSFGDAVDATCRSLCVAIVDRIVALDDEEDGAYSVRSSSIHCLSLFGKINPTLVTPHVAVLQRYLRPAGGSVDEARVSFHIASILALTLPSLKNLSTSLLRRLESDLFFLVSSQSIAVTSVATEAFCALAVYQTQNFSSLFALLNFFFRLNSSENLFLRRKALIGMGLMARFADLNAVGAGKWENGDDLQPVSKISDILVGALTDMDVDVRLSALKGFGLLLLRCPSMMTSEEVRGIVLGSLDAENEKENLQMIENLILLVRTFEEQAERHGQGKSAIYPLLDPSTMKDVVRRILPSVRRRCGSGSAVLRLSSVMLLRLTIEGRLVHIEGSVSLVMTLCGDPDPPVAQEARALFDWVILYGSESIVSSVEESVELVLALSMDGFHFGEIYRCVRERRPRIAAGLLRSFVRLLDESISNHALKRARYLCESISRFPFRSEREVMFVVGGLNRFLCLAVTDAYMRLKKDGDEEKASIVATALRLRDFLRLEYGIVDVDSSKEKEPDLESISPRLSVKPRGNEFEVPSKDFKAILKAEMNDVSFGLPLLGKRKRKVPLKKRKRGHEIIDCETSSE